MTEQFEPTHPWREPAELLRVLGHPLRLALLADLLEGPRCVTDLQQLLNARQANISPCCGRPGWWVSKMKGICAVITCAVRISYARC